jgi:hypothetical protein
VDRQSRGDRDTSEEALGIDGDGTIVRSGFDGWNAYRQREPLAMTGASVARMAITVLVVEALGIAFISRRRMSEDR